MTLRLKPKLRGVKKCPKKRFCMDCGIKEGKYRDDSSLSIVWPRISRDNKILDPCGICRKLQRTFCLWGDTCRAWKAAKAKEVAPHVDKYKMALDYQKKLYDSPFMSNPNTLEEWVQYIETGLRPICMGKALPGVIFSLRFLFGVFR